MKSTGTAIVPLTVDMCRARATTLTLTLWERYNAGGSPGPTQMPSRKVNRFETWRMKGKLVASLICLCVAACAVETQRSAASGPAGLQNLLIEPGFENGGFAWQRVGNAGRSVVAFPVHTGTGALEMQLHASYPREVFQDVPIVAGTPYDIGAWIKTSGVNGNGTIASIEWRDVSDNLISTDQPTPITGTQTWAHTIATYTAPSAATTARVRLFADIDPDGVGAAWFDDIEFIGAPGQSDPTPGFVTYIGGSLSDFVRDVAFDAQGNLYAAGGSASSDFPTTPGAYDTSLDTTGIKIRDATVMKFTPNGSVIWATLVGGPEHDRAYAVEVDAQGYVYIAGRAGPGFPTTAGVLQPGFAGDLNPNSLYGVQDGFVTKLSPDGSSVIWSTFFGTDDRSFIRDMDIDDAGQVYVVLTAVSRAVPHVTSGAFQTALPSGRNAVVAKISADGTQVIWASYLGGSNNDVETPALRVDPAGHVHVMGGTDSTDMPTTALAFDRTYGGNYDVHVAKFTADGSDLVFGTYLGGSALDGTETHGLALDSLGKVVVAATTTSTDFPVTAGAWQTTYGGSGGQNTGQFSNYPGDAFVAILSEDGTQRLAATFLGGQFGEGLEGVMLDAANNIYITGATYSDDFPVTGDAYQSAYAGNADFFAAKLSPDLSELLYATYMGGAGTDFGRTSAADARGNFYIGGHTQSDDFPVLSAFQTIRRGDWDGVAIRLRTTAVDCTGADGALCDDTDPCTTGDICSSGVCSGVTIDCSGFDLGCQIGVCNSTSGQCEPTILNDGQPCDADGDPCTTGGSCGGGICSGETPLDCNDQIPCTVDDCTGGTCVNQPSDALCQDDGLYCTGREYCNPAIGCTSPGNPCFLPKNCDETLNACGCESPELTAEGPRYLRIQPPIGSGDIALYLTGVDAEVACITGYVQQDGSIGTTPTFRPPTGDTGWGSVHLSAEGLISGMTYGVQAECNPTPSGTLRSTRTTATLWQWGDVDANTVVDIIDITRIVDAFRGVMLDTQTCTTDIDCANVLPDAACNAALGRCIRVTVPNVDLIGSVSCAPDGVINIRDIAYDIDAFRGVAPPCGAACP